MGRVGSHLGMEMGGNGKLFMLFINNWHFHAN